MSTLARAAPLVRESRKSNPGFWASKGNHTACSIFTFESLAVSGFPGLTFSTSDCLTEHLKSDTISTEE